MNTRIDGIDVTTVLAAISETDANMSHFPSPANFASWMGLCSGTKITGGEVMNCKTKRGSNRAAHELAPLIDTMLSKGEEYTPTAGKTHEERYRERALRQPNQHANKMGIWLVTVEPTA